jgi:hypothetical protein
MSSRRPRLDPGHWLGAMLVAAFAAALGAVAIPGPALAFSFGPPSFGGTGPHDDRPQPGTWDFRQMPLSNARGMPPAPPPAAGADGTQPGGPGQPPQQMLAQGQPPQAQWPGGQVQGYTSQPQWLQGQGYAPPSQWPPGPMSGQSGYGQAPGYQNSWQYGYPGGYSQQGSSQAAARPPRVELAITNDQPYVQENVLLRLRLISDQSLERIDPELPNSNDFLLKRVEKLEKGENVPWLETTTRQGSKGQREIVYDLILSLTPLRAGDLDLPPIKVTGTQAGTGPAGYPSQSTRYEVSSDRSRIQVRPVMTSVSPWLPLHDLSITANLDAAKDVQEGQPVTISLELKAVGATGAQLPSLEGSLDSPDYRVYREQTLTEGGLSTDKRNLVGKRTEYYTLVPHSGGRLRVSQIQLAWWNVDKGTREIAGLPIRTLQVDGESGPFGLSRFAGDGQGQGLGLFWFPVAGLLLLLLGYWGGVWYQRRAATGKAPLRAQAGASMCRALRATAAGIASGVARIARRINPARALAGARRSLTLAVPAPTRLWLCVSAADRETDPAAWCRQFQEQTCNSLAFDPKDPLAGLSNQLARVRPGADRAQIERLIQQLDGALYGRQEIDFPRWKRDFKRSLRPRRGAIRSLVASLTPRRVYLPALNPC